eukprot:COSAG02_NODE_41345_length_395_cov_1.300676_1_plen_67_part_10
MIGDDRRPARPRPAILEASSGAGLSKFLCLSAGPGWGARSLSKRRIGRPHLPHTPGEPFPHFGGHPL